MSFPDFRIGHERIPEDLTEEGFQHVGGRSEKMCMDTHV
jgi:hypothetical protein